MVEIRVLGPVEVSADGRALEPGRPQQQVVLASLAVEAGRPVPAEALLDRISGRAPPRSGSQLLYTHITRIRRMLAGAHHSKPATVRVARRSGGYVLEIPPEQVDVHRFHGLIGRATPERSAPERASMLRQALDLWRGEPLTGLSGEWADSLLRVWRQRRLAALVGWASAMVEAGEPAAAVDPLVRESAEHPLVEPLQAVLMRALAATGRGAEALAHYATIRRRLADDLGVDPGPELRAVHRAILRGDRVLADTAGSATAASTRHQSIGSAPPSVAPLVSVPVPPPAVPAQLPADVPAFVGRDSELKQLDERCGEPPAVVVISGTAGVGKTALVIHWAHRAVASGWFPHGQIYLNLRGFDPEQPLTPGDALARMLTAVGVPQHDIPLETDERAARFRSEVAGCRILIVLDNAADGEQIRPLLPGAGCVVLITSRDSLPGLVAVHGAERLELDQLPDADGLALLRRLIGERVLGDPAATMLVRRCARLPLALRVAAELVVSRPDRSLSELVEELADRQQRLELLDAGGDPRAAVASVFSWSTQHLPAQVARVFGWLGGHPGEQFDSYAVASLADTSLPTARRILDQLARAHLVQPAGSGRFGMHDLLRAYALRFAGSDDPERHVALERLFDYYLAAAAAAMDQLHPAETDYRPRVAAPAGPLPHLPDPATANRWLDLERLELVAVAAHAAGRGRADYPVRLSAILHRYLDQGHHADALTLHSHALRAAAAAGETVGQAHALRGLGSSLMRLSRYDQAVVSYHRAADLFQQAGDRFGESRVHSGLGLVDYTRARFPSALAHYERALEIAGATVDRLGEAMALNGLGIVNQRLGRDGAAAGFLVRSFAAARACGDTTGEAVALDNLGRIQQRLGRYQMAADYHERALSLVRQLGHRVGEANVLVNLGTSDLQLGRRGAAVDHFDRALVIFRETGDRDGQAMALNGLGEAAGVAGEPARAIEHHTAAMVVAADVGAAYQHARAHIGLHHAYAQMGDYARSEEHRKQAMELDPGGADPRL